MLNYLEGANHCESNSDKLQTSARIILKDSNGTDSFGLFLYYIGYEEIAKGIFCLFVHRGYVTEEFVNIVFQQHHPKIALFEEIFRSFEVHAGTCYLQGKKLGEIPLNEFIKDHIKKIQEHRRKTMDFLYVDRGDNWKVPEVEVSDIEKKEHGIKSKIHALNLIFEFLKNEIDKVDTQVDNFKFYENPDGSFTVQYDQI